MAVNTADQIPQWVNIAKDLGVPTIMGAIIGYAASLIGYYMNSKKETKKWRQEIAQTIMKEVYSYNAVAVNALHQESGNEIFVEAARKINEVEAIADLFVSNKVLKNIREIKKLVLQMSEEIKEKIKSGQVKGTRYDLESGIKYDKELAKLKVNLSRWIENSN